MSRTLPTTVYLADLRHDYSGTLSLDHIPLGVGFMKAVMDRDLPAGEVQVRIFGYPDNLLRAMREAPPDVLMVSNYVWNEALSRYFLRQLHELNPAGLAVMGGPNIPAEPERQVEFVAARPEIDLYVTGEGDFLAAELVQQYLDAGRSKKALFERDLTASIYRRDGEWVRHDTLPRRRGLDEIPSPWLSGVLDEFFDGKLCPLFETNRGCPFSCSFCVQGTDYYDRVNYFSLERLQEEIDYIGRTIHEKSPNVGTLRIADPNFGMYKRDVQIAEALGKAQRDYGWPTYIDATTGKNKPERIIECVEKVNGALVVYQAVQSLDDEVLRNVERSNIKLEAYEQIMLHVRGRGLRSNSDLILGLPGESLQSHLRGLHKLVDAGTNECNCFQAMMLKGSDLEKVDVRKQYEFETGFRVLPKDYGEYGADKVFEIEEIIVGTDTMPFEDYVECRKHHLAFGVFWNDSLFQEVVDFVGVLGVKPSEWLVAMLDGMKRDTGEVKELLDSFEHETRNELFPSREECAAFYAEPENFDRLRRGEIGDNVLYKHRAKASFYIWKEVCAVAMAATRGLLVERGLADRVPDFERFWQDLHAYTEARHAAGKSIEEVVEPVEATMRYDIARWAEDGCPEDVGAYRLAREQRFLFWLTDDRRRELEGAFQTWTLQLGGLVRLIVRIRRDSQVRSCEPITETATREAG